MRETVRYAWFQRFDSRGLAVRETSFRLGGWEFRSITAKKNLDYRLDAQENRRAKGKTGVFGAGI